MNRRNVLRGAAAGVCSLSAGCSVLGGQGGSGSIRVEYVQLFNQHSDPHTIHLQVGVDGNTVVDRDVDLAAGSNDDPAGERISDLPDERGHWDLQFSVDDREQTYEFERDLSNDSGCQYLICAIQTDGNAGLFGGACDSTSTSSTTSQ